MMLHRHFEEREKDETKTTRASVIFPPDEETAEKKPEAPKPAKRGKKREN